MKKRVIIESTPKKRVVIESLPKAQIGTRVSPKRRAQLAIDPLNQFKPKTAADFIPLEEKNVIKRKDFSQAPYQTNSSGLNTYMQDQQNQDVIWDPLQKGEISIPEIKQAPNYKQELPNYDIHPWDFYDPTPKEETTLKKPTTKLKNFGITPFTNNPYYNRGIDDFNQAMGHAQNLGKKPSEQTIPYGYNGPLGTPFGQYAQEGAYIPEYGDAGTVGKGMGKLNTAMNSIAGLGNLGSSAFNFYKGAEYNLGNKQSAIGAQNVGNELHTQSKFYDAMNIPDYEEQGYGFQGRNGLAQDGMQIREIGGMGEPNVEIEGKEHVLLPDGFSQEAQGKSHANGGIALNLPEGSKIYSEHLKLPVDFLRSLKEENNAPMAQEGMETGQSQPSDSSLSFLKYASLPKKGKISYADLAKKFETKKNADMLNAKYGDDIQKETAEMMIKFKKQKLEDLFAFQEGNKEDGMHGPEVQMNAMQNESSYGRYGLEMAKDGVKTGGTKKITIGNKTVDASYYPKGQVPAGFTPVPGYPNYYQKITSGTPGTQGTPAIPGQKYIPVENAWWKSLTPAQKAEHNAKVRNMIKTDPKYTGTPATPGIPATPGAEEYAYVEDQTKPFIKQQPVRPNVEVPVNFGLNIPGMYGESMLNYYKINPNYIDPRYLDIQPELNTIGRAQRTVQGNLGSRGATDIANLLQAQVNAGQQQQQAYGTKYNYDRAQDAAAQQFNAQAKTGVDQYNQGSWFQQLEDPHRRILSSIEDQKLTDYYRGLERGDQAAAYANTKNYIGQTFPNYQNMTGEQVMGYLAAANPQFMQIMDEYKKKKTTETEKEKQGDKTTTSTTTTQKYGGKIKLKPKLKRKY